MVKSGARHISIDVLDGLRLLYSAASEEARPILKAAENEIKYLRAEIAKSKNSNDDRH